MISAGDNTLLLAEAGVGLGIAGLCTIPAISSIARQLCGWEKKRDSYEDQDGKATPESISRYSNKWTKGFVVVFGCAGLGCQIAQSVLSSTYWGQGGPPLWDHLVSTTWALLAVQALAITASRSPVETYDLGLGLFVATVAHLTMGLLRSSLYLQHLYNSRASVAGLVTASIALALCLAVASISLPRRPDVYLGSRVVDRMMSTSAYQRFTFGWCTNILKVAAKKDELKAEDLPAPNHSTRSSEISSAWRRARSDAGPLWRSLLWAYKWPILVQTLLSLADGAVSYLPHWCELQILTLLERRHRENGLDSHVWFFVFALGAATVASSIIESNMRWAGLATLQLPVRAQLSAVIFEKSMRRKNVKSASRSDKDKSQDNSNDEDAQMSKNDGAETGTKKPEGDTKQDADDEDDEGADQKSRQAVINLISVDARTIADSTYYISQVFMSISGLIAGVWFLVTLLGWIPILLGVFVWGITMPINGFVAQYFGKNYAKLMVIRDQKLTIVTEALQGIRQVKFSALEQRWERRILAARQRELAALWKLLLNQAVLITLWFLNPIALAAVSFSVYVWLHGALTPAVAFVAVSVFSVLEEKLSGVPMILKEAVEAWVSMKRIQEYLDGPELEWKTQEGPEVAFKGTSVAWPAAKDTDESERFVLRGIDLVFPKGEVSVVSGHTGSGKSLLLAAILGEADILAGSISAPKATPPEDRFDGKANQENWILDNCFAFVGQIPWLENATLRDNILFGLPYNQGRYDEAVEACALTKDMEMLPDKDKTELGPNGINISGGQKWRVTLARAVYSRAGILVLDDIFSAVDTHVGRHLLDKCLKGKICKGRTRIVVTHHVGLVAPVAKYVVELADGGVAAAGLKSELENDGVLERIKSHELSRRSTAEFDGPSRRNTGQLPVLEDVEEGMADELDGEVDGGPIKLVRSRTAQKFVEDEKVEKGNVKWSVYQTYIRESGGWFWWTLALIIFIVSQVLLVGRNWWLKIWTETNEGEISSHPPYVAYPYLSMMPQISLQVNSPPSTLQTEHSPGFYLGIYVGITVISAMFQSMRYLFMFVLGLKASHSMFEKMTFTVLRTPLRWIDKVPVGRILNRFAGDFNSVDMGLIWSVAIVGATILQLMGICAAAVFVTPYILVLAAFLLGICAIMGRQYLGGARPIKRLESTTKSPILELFGTALAGVSTLRGFGSAGAYVDRMHARLDDYSTATWYLYLSSRWMDWRLGLVGFAYTILVVAIIVRTPDMTAALAGFTISFTVRLSSIVQALIQSVARIELDMNAAERIIEYTALETEDLGGKKPPAGWPTRGEITVEKLVVRYGPDLPPVLKGVGFTVYEHERVGIVGRTGSGKSTLTLSLFRFLEPSSGAIYIDGLDISKLSLHDLRSRLAIIPQDPVLFSGTLRSNIDPFDDYSDAEIHDCLQRVHLVSSVDSDSQATSEPGSSSAETTQVESQPAQKNISIFKDLSSPISEGGQNLSQGQRQLLCIARAIISRPKIMVLDEATSAVDILTDSLIQQSIREEFANATLLVIAHRLSTIADFDRILVLDDGKVVEFGSPAELWQKAGGVFRGMCNESGEREKLEAIIDGSWKA